MTFQILEIVKNLEKRLMGYCVLLGYRYMNLCTKAEPVSLLSATVVIDGNEYEIEKVAHAAIPDKMHIYLYPLDKTLIPYICAAMLKEHPEMKQDIIDDPDGGEKPGKVISLSIPPVDEDRKDALTDMVNALHEDCCKRMEMDYNVAVVEAAKVSMALPAETQDETKEELKKTYDSFRQNADKYKENKIKEIEEAYAALGEEAAKEEEQKKEEQDAKGLDSILKMTLDN